MGVDLSIVIVTWNVWDLVRTCLHSIERVSRPTAGGQMRAFGPVDQSATLEVIVVDNASTDATVSLLPARFPWVRLIRNAENEGFTAGNNAGYTAAGGRFIYFLNPDTELTSTVVTGDSLGPLYAVIARDETIGLVGPQLRYADNSPQSSRRRFPTPLTGFFESTWLAQRWPSNRWARRLYLDGWPDTFTQDVDWVSGAALLARREALEAVRMQEYVGPFDEGFFMYSEELDLCQRLKAAGWRIVYVPQAVVIHYEGRSSEQATGRRHIYFNTSKVHYYRKYFGPVWAEALRRYLLAEFRWQLWQEQAKSLVGHKRKLRSQRITAYKQVLSTGLRDEP